MKPYIPKSGYLGPIQIFNIKTYFHWSFPVGGLFVAFFIGESNITAGIYLIIAYTSLILLHELGHAIAAIHYSKQIKVILLTGAGGWCFAEEPNTVFSKLLFYSGGIIAQFIALILTVLLLFISGNPESLFLNCFVLVYTIVNIALIIINLYPSQHTDGLAIVNLLFKRSHA